MGAKLTGKYENPVKSLAGLFPARVKAILSAPAVVDTRDPAADLAKRLHPGELKLVISAIEDETPDLKTIRLEPAPDSGTTEIPVFRPGQYLCVHENMDGATISRPYSLCSTPLDAWEGNFCKIAIKKKIDGFLTPHIWDTWQVGTRITTSSPVGHFGYNEIRDSKRLVGICGGCGVTPMHAMMRHIAQSRPDLEFTLFYGVDHLQDLAFTEEFAEYSRATEGRIKVYPVVAKAEENWNGPKGFITAALIKEHLDPAEHTFFICGPAAMYAFLQDEMPKLDLPRRRLRWEVMGEDNSFLLADEQARELLDREFKLTVRIGRLETTIPARGGETLLTALERAGIACPSQCRSGECGFCRSRLWQGDVNIRKTSDGRRMGDMQLNFIHPCSAYPMSDMTMEVFPHTTPKS